MSQLEDDSQAIIEGKKILNNKEVIPQLAVIKSNFPVLVNTIKALEERLPLVKSMELVQKLGNELTLQPFADKFKKVLEKNPGFEVLQTLAKVFSGDISDIPRDIPSHPAHFANAPIVTCDVERSFSLLKDISTDKRSSMTEEHVKDVLIIQWNKPIVK